MEKFNKPKVKRLIVDLPEGMHNDIKGRAAQKNMTIKKYVLQALFEQMKKERI